MPKCCQVQLNVLENAQCTDSKDLFSPKVIDQAMSLFETNSKAWCTHDT